MKQHSRSEQARTSARSFPFFSSCATPTFITGLRHQSELQTRQLGAGSTLVSSFKLRWFNETVALRASFSAFLERASRNCFTHPSPITPADCSASLGSRLEGEEVNEALKLLDTDKNGECACVLLFTYCSITLDRCVSRQC